MSEPYHILVDGAKKFSFANQVSADTKFNEIALDKSKFMSLSLWRVAHKGVKVLLRNCFGDYLTKDNLNTI